MATIATITISAVDYYAYASVADADAYFAASTYASAWSAAATLAKQQALITAARIFNRYKWKGERTVATQPLDFPRSGITDRDGYAVADTDVPPDIIYGSYELALILIQDTDSSIIDTLRGNGNIKLLKAGSVMIEYFRPVGSPPIPLAVWDFIKWYWKSATPSLPLATGTSETSHFTDCDAYSKIAEIL